MPGKLAEFTWPALVANKIFNKRLGSSNFTADYHVDQSSLSSKTILDLNDHKDTQNYKIFVSTWNVGGIAPDEGLNMEDLLETCNKSCDIYVLGFQEIVPLIASNVLGYENSKNNSGKWNSIIRKSLNKSTHQSIKDQGDDFNKKQEEDVKNNNNNICFNQDQQYCEDPQDFECIINKQMVGILISVWAKRELRPFIQHPSVSCVGCGIMGCLGNKGSVSVRHVILLGDLNYRISLPEEKKRLLVENEEWDSLLEYDQLKELMRGNMLKGWQEGIIKFAPTYKYCPNTDMYYHGKKGAKKRPPAWCDRIVWFGNGLNQIQYGRCESKLSDHRPVKALFIAQVRVSAALKSFETLFLSDRFQQIKTHFVCKKQLSL